MNPLLNMISEIWNLSDALKQDINERLLYQDFKRKTPYSSREKYAITSTMSIKVYSGHIIFKMEMK